MSLVGEDGDGSLCGCEAEIEGDFRKRECYVFEPGLGALSGLSISETVVRVGGTGRIYIPLQTVFLVLCPAHLGVSATVKGPAKNPLCSNIHTLQSNLYRRHHLGFSSIA